MWIRSTPPDAYWDFLSCWLPLPFATISSDFLLILSLIPFGMPNKLQIISDLASLGSTWSHSGCRNCTAGKRDLALSAQTCGVTAHRA